MSGELIPLPDLPARIEAAHSTGLKLASGAVSEWIEAGRLLEQAQQQVKHGKWIAWVEANCSFGIREAQHYIRIYANRSELEAKIRNGVSHLTSLRGAIHALAEPTAKRADPPQDKYRETLIDPDPPAPKNEKKDEHTDQWRAKQEKAKQKEDEWIKAEIAKEDEWIKAKTSANSRIEVSLDELVRIRKTLRDSDKSDVRLRNYVISGISQMITGARLRELRQQERDRYEAEQAAFWRQMEELIRENDEIVRRLEQMRSGTSATYTKSFRAPYSENLKVLGLVAPVTRLELRKAYIGLAMIHHPDRGGNTAEFQRIQGAYEEASRQMSA
jgi:hypothetical protein